MKLSRAVSYAEKLEILPKNAIAIRQIVSNEESSFRDLEKAVAINPTLAANILKLANSPYFGVCRQVETLRQALIVIGFEATRDLALALSLLSISKRQAIDVNALWHHSASTAAISRALAQVAAPGVADEAFVAGLLHDIGKLIRCLIQTPPPAFLVDAASTIESLQAERSRDGFDHAELGAACLQQWRLSTTTCAAIRHHHHPEQLAADAPGGQLARILAIADGWAHTSDPLSHANVEEIEPLELGHSLSLPAVVEAVEKAMFELRTLDFVG
ncbi:MAG: HDOD domain-containing protein [Myxococcota bacterium]